MLEDTDGEPRLDAGAGPTPAADHGYEVGYRRPPLHSRFKPGTSGNKKGRPKGSRNAKTIVEGIVNSPVTIRENGKARKTTKLEAMLLAGINKAMQGDTPALNSMIGVIVRSGLLGEPDQEQLMTSLPEEDEAILRDYVRRQPAEIESPAVDSGEVR
jgi:hypothetical protein